MFSSALRAVAVVALTGAATVALVRLAPGFGLDERIADATLGEQTRAAIATEASRSALDWGESSAYGVPVTELIVRRWRPTALAVAGGLALAWCAALGFVVGGFVSRMRAPSAIADALSALLMAAPAALVGLAVFVYRWNVAVAIGAAVFPMVYRVLRNRFDAAERGWPVVAAESRGIAAWRVALRHVLWPERAEVAMLAALSFKWAISAAIPAEVFSGQAGLGQLVWKAAEARDLALIVPLTLAIAAAVQLAQAAAAAVGERA